MAMDDDQRIELCKDFKFWHKSYPATIHKLEALEGQVALNKKMKKAMQKMDDLEGGKKTVTFKNGGDSTNQTKDKKDSYYCKKCKEHHLKKTGCPKKKEGSDQAFADRILTLVFNGMDNSSSANIVKSGSGWRKGLDDATQVFIMGKHFEEGYNTDESLEPSFVAKSKREYKRAQKQNNKLKRKRSWNKSSDEDVYIVSNDNSNEPRKKKQRLLLNGI